MLEICEIVLSIDCHLAWFVVLVKHLDGIDEATISELNIPTGTPLVYELDDNLQPIPQEGAIEPLQGRYLGDQDAIRARIEGVKNQTK